MDVANEVHGEKVAFVLSGGASHGAVQVGMLRALSEAGIVPDFLVGASVGALNAAAYAANPTPDGIQQLAASWTAARSSEVFPANARDVLKAIGGRSDHLVSNRGVRQLIERTLTVSRVEDTVLPLHVVATDMVTGEAVVISKGDLVTALLASSAIPGIFPPVRFGPLRLVDGGVVADTPVLQAEALGATTIYVLPTFGKTTKTVGRPNAFRSGWQAVTQVLGQVGALTVAATKTAEVRVVPAPPTMDVNPLRFTASARLIDEATDLTRAWLATEDFTTSSRALTTEFVAGRSLIAA